MGSHDTSPIKYPRGAERMAAFSDAVLAIIITIMALELRPPQGTTLDSLDEQLSSFLIYILSFIFIGIYWVNHHHLLRATQRITGGILWANLHLVFWLALIPAVTTWVGNHPDDPWPAVVYGIISIMAASAYYLLTRLIIRADSSARIAMAIGRDAKGIISEFIYAAGIGLAFINPLLAYAMYALVSILWIVPDRRLEHRKPV